MSFGERLKYLRKQGPKTLKKCSEVLGVSISHIAALEKNRKTPSKQLILNVCHVFGVNERWIEKGKGEMTAPVYVPQKSPIIDDIIESLKSGESNVSPRVIRAIVSIQDRRISTVLADIESLFVERDESKIEAFTRMLRVSVPKKDRAEWARLREGRAALDKIAWVKRAPALGNKMELKEDFEWAISILKKWSEQGYFLEEYKNAVKEYEDFIKDDPAGSSRG